MIRTTRTISVVLVLSLSLLLVVGCSKGPKVTVLTEEQAKEQGHITSPEKDDGDAEGDASKSARSPSAQRSPRKATFEDVVTEILGDNFPVTREELFKGLDLLVQI